MPMYSGFWVSVQHGLVSLILAALIGLGYGQSLFAAETGDNLHSTTPLLMPGKHSLYQRVLASPGSQLYPRADKSSPGKPITPFTIYYVYQDIQVNHERWLQLGSDNHGALNGWAPAEQFIPWNQALTVAFKDPQDIDRVLLFKDKKELEQLVQLQDKKSYEKLYNEAVSGKLSANSPVVAIQPTGYIDIRENFYLVPIKQYEDVYLGNEHARLLKVATVPLGVGKQRTHSYRSGIVFVMDTTQSMRPYVDQTREVTRKVFGSLNAAGLKEKVSFGLTAFQDHPKAVPANGYLTKSFVTLTDGSDPTLFFKQVDNLNVATVSNRDFMEDSFAGIKQAIEGNNWEDFDARYIILVTDASARAHNDPLSSTHLGGKSLQQLAHDKGIAIWALHLLTPMGTEDHARAEQQYRELSFYPGIGDFYYGVKTGDVTEFGRILEALAKQLTQQIQATVKGTPPLPIAASPTNGQLAEFQGKVAKLGYALQMRYLQQTQGKELPNVFDAWLIDRDFRKPERSSIEVRVLLTRDQLSDLRNTLQQVLELAEEGVLSPRNFLNELKSLAAILSRNPSGLSTDNTEEPGEHQGSNLAELGLMKEYIEDLPYVSEVMDLSLEDWEDWSAKQQLTFVHSLETKISYYQALHDHTDLWVSPGGGPITGDSVFPVLLEMLP